MKKIILSMIALVLLMSACEIDNRGIVQPERQSIEEVDYHIKFLFEVDGVKMYQFDTPSGRTIYFTVPASRTHYKYTKYNGKFHTTTEVECLNADSLTIEYESL